jgi:hypothetical protein
MAAVTVVVAGALANKAGNGGEAWVRLSWIRGLQRLGCDVWFVETIAERTCTGADGRPCSFDVSTNRRWFLDVTLAFGLADRSCLVSDSGATAGCPLASIETAASGALLVNISGHLAPDAFGFSTTAHVDIDPGYTQVWHHRGDGGARVVGHDLHFTIGTNIGTDRCPIPTDGIEWRPVVQPVVMADWTDPAPRTEPFAFSTVASWRGAFGVFELDGTTHGQKAHQFRRFLDLPRASHAPFELALAIDPADRLDRDALLRHGWRLRDPHGVAGTVDTFREYVRSSAAEFSVAQGVYVQTRNGWFSDRTTRYLAAGRPALVQDTGFPDRVPTGKGVLAFTTMADAVLGAADIMRDYELHSAAAREVAAAVFSSDVVLSRFLEECGR